MLSRQRCDCRSQQGRRRMSSIRIWSVDRLRLAAFKLIKAVFWNWIWHDKLRLSWRAFDPGPLRAGPGPRVRSQRGPYPWATPSYALLKRCIPYFLLAPRGPGPPGNYPGYPLLSTVLFRPAPKRNCVNLFQSLSKNASLNFWHPISGF